MCRPHFCFTEDQLVAAVGKYSHLIALTKPIDSQRANGRSLNSFLCTDETVWRLRRLCVAMHIVRECVLAGKHGYMFQLFVTK